MPAGKSASTAASAPAPAHTFPLSLKTPAPPNGDSEQLQTLKRKFQRVNQEVVKQNVALHDQLAKHKHEQHLVLQENVRLKGRIVALEGKLRESESLLIETKVRTGGVERD